MAIDHRRMRTSFVAPDSKHGKRSGYTLTELALGLAIVALIIGAIWGAASAVYQNNKVSEAEKDISSTAMAVRDMYGTSGVTGATSPGQVITAPSFFPNKY